MQRHTAAGTRARAMYSDSGRDPAPSADKKLSQVFTIIVCLPHHISSLKYSNSIEQFPTLFHNLSYLTSPPSAVAMGEFGESEKTSAPTTEEVHDFADAAAIGGYLKDLPPGYCRSPKSVGSIIGVILMANGLYLGFLLPVRC